MAVDALAAIGLAGNIVQFIQFACEIVSESRRVYHSVSGASAEHINLEVVAQNLQNLIAPLRKPNGCPANPEFPNPSGSENDGDGELLDLEDELRKESDSAAGMVQDTVRLDFDILLDACNEVANELLQALQQLKLKDGPSRRWRSFGKALASVWKAKKMASLLKRLMFLREQVSLHIMDSLSIQQTVIRNELMSLRRGLEDNGINRERVLGVIDSNVDRIRYSVNTIDLNMAAIRDVTSQMLTKSDLDKDRETIKSSLAVISEVSGELDILRSLSFPSMQDRHRKIADAYTKTFGWIFESDALPATDVRSRIKLGNWLEHGGGIFWVSGKAGSGKSTLMKWLTGEARTRKCLRTWANGTRLVTAGFYFWYAGTDMQKSQHGLLQSLLFEILSKCPDLIPVLCPKRWSTYRTSSLRPWTPQELSLAFDLLQDAELTGKKFCFFIDGLDEYDGDHFDLIDIMKKLVKCSHIKICLSSRPWNCFEDAFGSDSGLKLYLQDLTREDIGIYSCW